jgi:hypothetical protein
MRIVVYQKDEGCDVIVKSRGNTREICLEENQDLRLHVGTDMWTEHGSKHSDSMTVTSKAMLLDYEIRPNDVEDGPYT